MSNANNKATPTKKRPSKDDSPYVRKLAERDEVVEFDLHQPEIDELGRQVLVLLDEDDKINQRKDEAAKNFASQLKTNKLQIDELRGVIKEKKRRMKLHIIEYLTKGNEVMKIRADTGEPVGKPRTATPRELQEELFDKDDKADDPEAPDEIADDNPFGGAPS